MNEVPNCYGNFPLTISCGSCGWTAECAMQRISKAEDKVANMEKQMTDPYPKTWFQMYNEERQNHEDYKKRALKKLEILEDSIEHERPQVTHSYYATMLRVHAGDLRLVLEEVKARPQDEVLNNE